MPLYLLVTRIGVYIIMVLEVVFWVLIILGFAGTFAPEPWNRYGRYVDLILFVILGLRIFGFPH